MKEYFTTEITNDIAMMVHGNSKTLNDLKIDIQNKYPEIPKTHIEHKIKELSSKTKTASGNKWMIKEELKELYSLDELEQENIQTVPAGVNVVKMEE